ncbi:hypothetical protein GTW93_24120 [Streptomyces sp. SID5789]|nr:hypothetical protein [Streptomyces sp. SID5789]
MRRSWRTTSSADRTRAGPSYTPPHTRRRGRTHRRTEAVNKPVRAPTWVTRTGFRVSLSRP